MILQVGLLLLFAGPVVYGRPENKNVHVVYSETQTGAVPAPPEPRSGVAYVYSVPATLPPLQNSDVPLDEALGRGESAPLEESQLIFKEVTVSKKVGFHKGSAKVQTLGDSPSNPLDPATNES